MYLALVAVGAAPYAFPAAVVSASEAARDLSLVLGAPVDVAKALRKDPVFIESHGAGPKVLLHALASAVGASVQPDGPGFLIARSTADLEAIRNHCAAVKATWISQHIQRVAKFRTVETASKPTLKDAFFATARRYREQSDEFTAGKRVSLDPFGPEYLLPSQELLEGLLKRIGYRKLAELPVGGVRVYMDQPTGSAERLPEAADLLAHYEASMQALRTAQIAPADLGALYPNQRGVVFAWRRSGPIASLRIVERAEEAGLSFRLQAFGPLGDEVASDNLDAGPSEIVVTPRAFVLQAKADPHSIWIPLSGDAVRAVHFAKAEGPVEALPPWYGHPDKEEPMNLFVREALSALAEREKDRPFVMAVSDSLWGSVAECCLDGRLSMDALDRTIASWTSYERLAQGEVVTWRPLDVEEEEHRLADRGALARFAHDLSTKGFADARMVGVLAHDACSKSAPLANSWAVMGQTSRGLAPLVNTDLGDDFFRVLGCFSDDNWSKLMAGQPVAVADSAVQGEISAAVRSTWGLRAMGRETVPEQFQDPVALLETSGPFAPEMALKARSEAIFKTWWPGDHEPEGGMTEPELLQHFAVDYHDVRWDGNTPELTKSRAEMETGSWARWRIRLCQRQMFDVRISLPKGLHLSGSVTGNIVPVSQPVTYSALPQGLKDVIWNHAYKEAVSVATMFHNGTAPGVQSIGSPPKITPP